jgi:amino acid transporter
VALHEIDAGRRPSVIGTYRAVLPSLGPLLGGWLLAAVVVVLLILSVVGIPVAIWLVVRWILHPQVCVSGRLGPLQSLRASRDLVRGRWWRTAAYGGLVHVIGVATGPVVGILLLFVTSASLVAINLVGSLVYVAVMPYVAIAMALYHQDLVLRRAEVGAAEPLRPSPASA